MTEFHIDPANKDGSPDESPTIKTWCVMHLGVKIASTSSPDLAKRMVHYFEALLEDGLNVSTKDRSIKLFKNKDLSAEVFTEYAELFMLSQEGWKPIEQLGNTHNQTVKQIIRSENKNK